MNRMENKDFDKLWNDTKRQKELVEKVQWYTLYGLGAVLLLSIGLIIYTHIFNS